MWTRLRETRLRKIDWNERSWRYKDTTTQALATDSDPEFKALVDEGDRIDVEFAVDHKSLFVFGDLVLSNFVLMSELMWAPPPTVEHHQGLTRFLETVARLPTRPTIGSRFGSSMAALEDALRVFDGRFGTYRDGFVVHLPEKFGRGEQEGITRAREFYFIHTAQPTEKETLDLRNALSQALSGQRMGLDLNRDPRLVLQEANERLHEIPNLAGVETIKKLVRKWGTRSPNVADAVAELVGLLDRWITQLEVAAAMPAS